MKVKILKIPEPGDRMVMKMKDGQWEEGVAIKHKWENEDRDWVAMQLKNGNVAFCSVTHDELYHYIGH